MVEIVLLAVLLAGLAGIVALGVEDTRHWSKVQAKAPRVVIRVHAEFWEDSLPHRQPLPWFEGGTKEATA